MNLIPREPFDNLFENFFPSLHFGEAGDSGFFSPSVDIEEQDNRYLITADMPGVKKEDIALELEDGVLTLRAERNEDSREEHKGRIIRRERRHGSFARSFSVGHSVTEADISAQFANGVLTLTIPRRDEAVASRKRIEIK